jgi:DNA-binding NarL/FixJ family response regulator
LHDTAPIRILVVDDYEPWRAFVSAMLRKEPELEIVGQASDGLEAVPKAQELQPDLILLDIGLPTLNGIEAARRIREVSPRSKVLFVTENRSVDVAEVALSTGASGYIVKSDAGSGLLMAINAVLRDEQFFSQRLADHETTLCHEAGFYSSDQTLVDHLSDFVGAALKRGNAAIVVATESHRENLLPRLQGQGLDMTAALEQGRYAAFDAVDTLSLCMQDQILDEVRFSRLVGNRIQAAANAAQQERNRVAVFGECVQLLWEQGNPEATIALERLWNQEILERYDAEVLCGYSADILQGRASNPLIDKIRAEHTAVHSR